MSEPFNPADAVREALEHFADNCLTERDSAAWTTIHAHIAALTARVAASERDADVLMDALLWLRTWASLLATHVDGHFALPTENSKAICIGHAEKVRGMVARADAAIDTTKKEERPR